MGDRGELNRKALGNGDALGPGAGAEPCGLAEILDLPELQAMLDEFARLTRLGIAVQDLQGKALVAANWQDICSRFHRRHPEACANCLESDTYLSRGISPGSYRCYRCKNNMWDVATPIVVADRHVGNMFVGQFFFEDEVVDTEVFRRQAARYGFDEQDYLAALARVPRCSRDTLDAIVKFYSRLSMTISNLSYSRIKLSNALAERDRSAEALRLSAELVQTLLDLHELAASLDSAQELLEASLWTVLAFSRSRMAFFGLLDEGCANMTLAAWASTAEDGCRVPQASPFMTLHDAGLWAECVRRRQPVIVNQYSEDVPGSHGLPSGHLPVERLVCIPIMAGERIVAISMVANRDTPYEAGDIAILRAVFNKIWVNTERKRSEENLKRLGTAVEQAAMDIVITDPEGTLLYVNPSMQRTFGYPEEELLGHRLREFRVPGSDPAFYQRLWDDLHAGRVWRGRLHNRARDGHVVIQDWIISPIRDGRGCTAGFVGTGRDMTREVEMEAHLSQAEKLEAIGTLAGGIAHDFNNILTGILGFTELALEASSSDHQRTCLRQIRSASLRAADLVKHILAFSRARKEEDRPTLLGPIVQEAMKLLRASLPATIEIRTRIASRSVVMINPEDVHRVIVNLCTNAALAMRDAGGILAVDLDDVDPDPVLAAAGRQVRLTVTDTGCGMTDEVRSHLFEPFFTTRPKGEGTGLGLSVVHRIVRDRGGSVSVTSAPGAGSAFTVLLPAVILPDRAEPEPAAPSVRGTERVLFVDDEPALVEMSGMALRRQGYAVTACASSTEAWTVFAAAPHAFDIVVSDMTMPGLTGDVLAGRIRALRPDLPIILCTGFSERMDEEKARSLGISAFVQKPVAPSLLAGLIRKAVDHGPSAGQAP